MTKINANRSDNKFNPFQKFENLNVETYESYTSANEKFSADVFFAKAGAFEFVFSSPFTDERFNGFADFFTTQVLPHIRKGSFFKVTFFISDFDEKFNFAKFNEFFDRFMKNGSTVEFSFVRTPDFQSTFGEFDFGGFAFPFDDSNDNKFFIVRQAEIR